MLTDSIGSSENDCSAAMEVCDLLSGSDDGLEYCLHCEDRVDMICVGVM